MLLNVSFIDEDIEVQCLNDSPLVFASIEIFTYFHSCFSSDYINLSPFTKEIFTYFWQFSQCIVIISSKVESPYQTWVLLKGRNFCYSSLVLQSLALFFNAQYIEWRNEQTVERQYEKKKIVSEIRSLSKCLWGKIATWLVLGLQSQASYQLNFILSRSTWHLIYIIYLLVLLWELNELVYTNAYSSACVQFNLALQI